MLIKPLGVSVALRGSGIVGSNARIALHRLSHHSRVIDRNQDRNHVAWDLETTGFAWSDRITVSGFWFPGDHTELIVNTGGEFLDIDQVQTRLEDASGGVSVSVTVADDELGLLEAMGQVLFERFDRQYNRLIAFNAESWKNGFDLPFLRTRCLKHNIGWLFDRVQFADLWNPIKKRMNTTHTAYGNSVSVNSLTGAHDLLFDEIDPTVIVSEQETETDHSWYSDNQYDPFEDSSSAVSCYNRRDYVPILQHNLADVHRTWELGELVRAFVSSKDITTKKL